MNENENAKCLMCNQKNRQEVSLVCSNARTKLKGYGYWTAQWFSF